MSVRVRVSSASASSLAASAEATTTCAPASAARAPGSLAFVASRAAEAAVRLSEVSSRSPLSWLIRWSTVALRWASGSVLAYAADTPRADETARPRTQASAAAYAVGRRRRGRAGVVSAFTIGTIGNRSGRRMGGCRPPALKTDPKSTAYGIGSAVSDPQVPPQGEHRGGHRHDDDHDEEPRRDEPDVDVADLAAVEEHRGQHPVEDQVGGREQHADGEDHPQHPGQQRLDDERRADGEVRRAHQTHDPDLPASGIRDWSDGRHDEQRRAGHHAGRHEDGEPGDEVDDPQEGFEHLLLVLDRGHTRRFLEGAGDDGELGRVLQLHPVAVRDVTDLERVARHRAVAELVLEPGEG